MSRDTRCVEREILYVDIILSSLQEDIHSLPEGQKICECKEDTLNISHGQ
jgi:hypothetical protein